MGLCGALTGELESSMGKAVAIYGSMGLEPLARSLGPIAEGPYSIQCLYLVYTAFLSPLTLLRTAPPMGGTVPPLTLPPLTEGDVDITFSSYDHATTQW